MEDLKEFNDCISVGFLYLHVPGYLPVYAEESGVVPSHLPGRPVSIMQVKSTSFCPVTALIGEMISTASQCAQETLKTTSCWQAAWPAEA